MKQTPQEHRLCEIAAPVIEGLGFALVRLRMTSGEGAQILEVMAEDPASRNLGLDDATKISRALSAVLDVEDPIKGAYRLEVSSPGIDRPLIRLQDFEDYKGFEAKLETEVPMGKNGQRRYRGILGGLKDETVLIETDQGQAEIPFSVLAKARLVLTDDLIKKTANP